MPRPGDEDFIPSQLPTLWNHCGDLWIQQQQQQQSSPDQPAAAAAADGGGEDTGFQSAAAAESVAVVDWPWRPRDLEALLVMFRLLVETNGLHYHFTQTTGEIPLACLPGQSDSQLPPQVAESAAAAAAAAGGGGCTAGQSSAAPAATAEGLGLGGGWQQEDGAGQGSVLTYEGFLGFWEEAGLRHWLSKVRGLNAVMYNV